MSFVGFLAVLAVGLGIVIAPGSAQTPPSPELRLLDPVTTEDNTDWNYNASGAGRTRASGRIDSTSDGGDGRTLHVDSTDTWEENQGIRVRHAGNYRTLNDADSLDPWWGPEGSAPRPTIDSRDRDGPENTETNAVKCSRANRERDMCSLKLPPGDEFRNFTAFDEVHLWVKPTLAMNPGDLQLVLFDINNNEIKNGALELPELDADRWNEAFVRMQGEAESDRAEINRPGPEAVARIVLRCNRACGDVSLDDVELVTDLLSRVVSINRDERTLTLRAPAGRSVSGEKNVYHDDTHAINEWLKRAERTGSQPIAHAGVYYVNSKSASGPLPLYSNTDLSCPDGPKRTIFRNGGGTATGPKVMFQTVSKDLQNNPAPDPTNISVTGCGFDSNGWNGRDFLSVVNFGPNEHRVSNIRIRNNRFFDSNAPGKADCDLGQDECATLQRQYVVALGVERDVGLPLREGEPGGLLVENNRLSGGGRIKARGADIAIRGNRLDFVNDNGITIVDRGKGVTQNVQITDNKVKDAVGVGIFFGSDGQQNFADGMELRDIEVARNDISGLFTNSGIKVHLPPLALEIEISDNTIQSAPPRFHPVNERPGGILVFREDRVVVVNPSTPSGIAINNNEVTVGRYGGYHDGAIRLEGEISNPEISGNAVACEPRSLLLRPEPAVFKNRCLGRIDIGIWLKKGTIPAPVIARNQVYDAQAASLQIGTHNSPLKMLKPADIYENQFSGLAWKPGKGRIWLQAIENTEIRAIISRNRINNNAGGWGVYCSDGHSDPFSEDPTKPPAERFTLTFNANTYANPERDVHPQCSPAVSSMPAER